MGRRIAPQNRSKKLPRGKPFPKGTSGNPDRRFKPGISGNAGGRPKKTPYTDAHRLVSGCFVKDLNIKSTDTVAEAVAKVFAREALKGKINAGKEITDRVEGKSIERVELTGEGGNPIQIDDRILELTERIKARAKKSR